MPRWWHRNHLESDTANWGRTSRGELKINMGRGREMPPTARVRKNISKLQGGGANAPAGDWDPILVWYAKAIAAMLAKSIDDPTSWRYQAAIHGFDASQTPLNPGEHALPTNEGDPWGQ